jgi:hypothetical protein
MPNQAMATAPRMMAGILEPRMPKAMRLMTGNGTPVRSPMKPERFRSRNSRMAPRRKASMICQAPSPRAKSPMAKT